MILKKTLLQNPKENTWAVTIALIVSFLGTFFLSRTQFDLIINSYEVLGQIVLFSIPLLIILLALHKSKTSPGIRRTVIVIYGILYFYFISEKSIQSNDTFTLIAVIVLGILIFFDKTVNESINSENSKNKYYPSYPVES
jgi:hypothetical protein